MCVVGVCVGVFLGVEKYEQECSQFAHNNYISQIIK